MLKMRIIKLTGWHMRVGRARHDGVGVQAGEA
jgi:hypothetical protein